MNFYALKNSHTEALMLHNGLCTLPIINIFMYLPTSRNEKLLTALELENNKCFVVRYTLKCYILIDVLELDNMIKVSTNDVNDVAFLFSTELLTLLISCVTALVVHLLHLLSWPCDRLQECTRMEKNKLVELIMSVFIEVYGTGQDCF